jgi:hypothetical protein
VNPPSESPQIGKPPAFLFKPLPETPYGTARRHGQFLLPSPPPFFLLLFPEKMPGNVQHGESVRRNRGKALTGNRGRFFTPLPGAVRN